MTLLTLTLYLIASICSGATVFGIQVLRGNTHKHSFYNGLGLGSAMFASCITLMIAVSPA